MVLDYLGFKLAGCNWEGTVILWRAETLTNSYEHVHLQMDSVYIKEIMLVGLLRYEAYKCCV